MEKMIKKFAEGRKSYLFPLFIISIAACLVLFFSYGYMDLKAWTVWSINLWDCLFDGKLWNYYGIVQKISIILNVFIWGLIILR